MGVGMLWLPALAPGLVAAHTAFGASTRHAWLLLMGALNASLGAGVLGWHALRQLWRIPAWLQPLPQPERLPEPVPLPRPQPVRAAA